jgi:hypothetical protein
MAYRLKDKNKQIPNGYKFVQPETGWQPARYSSFGSIVRGLMAHRLSRPELVKKHNWATDEDAVNREVEQFNVNLCLRHNWMNYIEGGEVGGAPPKSKALSAEEKNQVSAAAGLAKKIWSGIRTLDDWIDSDIPPVSAVQSGLRAEVCSRCPKNTPGDFTKWFTIPAAGAIKRQIEKLAERKLETAYDAKLNVCDVCLCPLKLKVHTPLEFIKKHTSEEVLADLMKQPECWVVSELSQK